jgi:hypothetical protein
MPLNAGDFGNYASMRGNAALSGLFDDSLFVVAGQNLYRINQDMTSTHISGIIAGTGFPEFAWQKGAGYERLWIADGQTLQVYSGTTFASGTVTKSGAITNGTDKVTVGGVWYTWGTSFSPSDAGTSANPFVVNPTSTGALLDPLAQLVLAVMDSGVSGVDYSSTIGGQNVFVGATADGALPSTIITFTAVLDGTGGNSITLSTNGSSVLTASGTHLANGGIDALTGVEVPGGLVPLSLAQVSGYVLLSIANTQQFYWVNPGELTIDALDFASKESSPDNITQLRTVGDQVLIVGEKSTENWYATGQIATPFAPIEGRVYARGAITGTPVVIDDGVLLVGDDGRVYSIGFQSGDATDAGWGVKKD